MIKWNIMTSKVVATVAYNYGDHVVKTERRHR